MKYVSAMLIKFVMIMIILTIVLGQIYNVAMDDVFTVSIILTGFSFVIGDLIILLRAKNSTATIADFVISFLVILAMGSLLFEGPVPLLTATLISTVILTIVEIAFHHYMRRRVFDDKKPFKISRMKYEYQTEFSEDMDVKHRSREK